MKRIFILMAALLVGLTAVAQPKIVAHRGYWRTDGSAQNSITSLQKAAAVGCYGSEFDVWLTADGVPVVFHDATIDGIRIEDTTFATLMNHRLQNGEFIPTLQQYLTEGSKIEGCQLILEIKPHRNEVRDKRIADMCVELVRTLGLEKKTEYISFSKVVCQRLHEITPDSKVAYLFGDSWVSQTAYKVLALVMLFVGGLATYTFVWDLGDVGVGLMTVFNIIVIIPMSGQALDCLREYERMMAERKKDSIS